MSAINADFSQLNRLIRSFDSRIVAPPLRAFLQRVTILIQGKARERAPVDTGRLRGSIATSVDRSAFPTWGRVGTNVDYAPFMEFGTGTQTDGDGGGARHWPPSAALDTWASSHGFLSGGQVAFAIGRRGGLKPRRFFRDALEEGKEQMNSEVRRLGDDIGDAFRASGRSF